MTADSPLEPANFFRSQSSKLCVRYGEKRNSTVQRYQATISTRFPEVQFDGLLRRGQSGCGQSSSQNLTTTLRPGRSLTKRHIFSRI